MNRINHMSVTICSIIIFSILITLLYGCDKYSRYKTLTFFFTGVPHPDEEYIVAQTDQALSISARTEDSRKKGGSFTHGPFAANQCFLCHDTARTVGFGNAPKTQIKAQKTSKRFDAGLPGRLLSPLQEICIECHPSKSIKYAFNKNLWIHGPVSTGLCVACHSPHSSPHRYMLLFGSSKEMCSSCHAEGYITPIEEHLRDEECINCHNAHLGKNRFLLKRDFEESY